MTRGLALALATVAILAAVPPAAQTTCRPNVLGSVNCRAVVPPPKPRPIYRSDVQALDRVLELPAPEDIGPELIPARRTRGLATIVPDPGTSPGRCRPDALGNLICK